MITNKWHQSIKSRLILAVALLHAILMTIFVTDLVHRQQSFLIEESAQSTMGIAKTLATNSIPWVLSSDFAGLEEIMRSQSQQPNLVFAMITDKHGKIIAYHHKEVETSQHIGKYINSDVLDQASKNMELAVFQDTSKEIDIAAPITVNNSLIGWARIHISRKHIFDSLQFITIEGLLYTLGAILIGTFFAWRLGHGLTKGIYTLISTTQKVRSGERDIVVSLNRNDELQTLSNNFQAMLNKLNDKEKELFSEKERLEITLKSIGDGVITTDKDGLITYMNPVAELLTGWSNFAAEGIHIEKVFKIYNETTMEPVSNPALKSMQQQKIISLSNHTVLINRAGEKISIEDSGAPIVDNKGDIVGAVLVFHDATEARQLRSKLTWQAMHDNLTDLYNRQAFENRLEQLIERNLEDNSLQHCLIYIDLDQFKVVNDTVGHSAGDELLKQIATIMEKQVRESDLLARIGGDEFAILLENCNVEHAERIAEKIRVAVFAHRFIWEDRVFDIGTSIGITLFEGAMSKATIMSQADVACYIAKEQGRNRIHTFREDDKALNQEFSTLDWVNRIKRAIENEHFVLFGQQVMPLQKTSDKKSLEILVRLEGEDGQIITPNQFLPAAERFNLMWRLDMYIVEKAFQWLRLHADKVERLNINISGQSLNNDGFIDALLDILSEDPQINSKVCFEITETIAITHMSACISFLNRVKHQGCMLALDDFGAGFSSFSWLKSLPVDFVKIDGSFILDVMQDKVDAAMVRAIHQISDEMNIQTVAEFVETQEVSDWLAKTGIDYAQGYFYHKPTPLEQIDF